MDEFTAYERGMELLLSHLQAAGRQTAYQEALLLQMRLVQTIYEARSYQADPTQQTRLNKILARLIDVSLSETGRSFYDWCRPLSRTSLAFPEVKREQANQDADSLQLVNAEKMHQELIDDFIALGAQPKSNQQAASEDILERYRQVPLHAIFLYTSEDEGISTYILKHAGALDSLSGNVCDIHPILSQFTNKEDAYDYIDRLQVVKAANFREYSKLPGLFFWDRAGNTAYVPFGSNVGSSRIKRVLRIVFEEVHRAPVLASVRQAKKLLEQDEKPIVREPQEGSDHPLRDE